MRINRHRHNTSPRNKLDQVRTGILPWYQKVPTCDFSAASIVAAGDELLPVGAPPAPGKIYDSDSPLLAALVRRDGGQPLMIGIAHDNLSSLRLRIASALAAGAELILTVAGTDHGQHDLVRELVDKRITLPKLYALVNASLHLTPTIECIWLVGKQ
ncbi:MAG: molybdopterin-binding protein [Oscillochloridaceae bacterium umkhey_bin13]